GLSMPSLRFSLSLSILASLAGCGMMEAQTKDGTQVHLIPAGESLVVSINGDEEKRLSKPVTLGLGPGTHTIAVRDGAEITVTLEAFDKVVVPLVPNQCFLSMNVSLSNFGEGGRKVPKISGRLQRSEPFPMPAKHYVSNSALPSSITSGQQVFLLASQPCNVADDLEFGINGAVTREGGGTDPIATHVTRVRRAACENDSASVWCTALSGWNDVTASPLPTEPQAFAGLAVAAFPGENFKLTPEKMSLYMVALNPKGAQLRIMDPYGETGKKFGLDVSAGRVANVLASESDPLSLPAEFSGYLGRQAQQAEGAITADGVGWRTDGAHLRLVGERWVSVLPTEQGAIVAINSPYTALAE
ncbi:MAG: hypothetical protein AB8H79_07900, partial [Myxococcota bacterium]